jgi:uncharacterized membrane protein
MSARFIAPLVLVAAVVPALTASAQSIIPVGLTNSGTSNQARGINDAGLVAGYDNITGGFQRLIDSTGPLTTDAGLPTYTTPITSAEGHSINNAGLIVGVGRYSAPAPGSSTGSVPYDRGVVFNASTDQYLAVIEPFNDAGGRRAFAQSINNQNRVVGNGSSDAVLTNQNPRRAFWYDVSPTQSLTNYKLDPAVNGLPFLPGGVWSVAYDINDNQRITGFAQTPDDTAPTPVTRNRAVIWNAGAPDANGNPYTTVTRIDTRNTPGTSSLARSINDNGTVVGRMTFSTTSGDEAAFVYRAGDPSITSLGFLGTTRTEAIDINNNGLIVGYAGVTEGNGAPTNTAVLWVPDASGPGGYQAVELSSFITLGSVATGGWTRLLEARAINDDNTIVGYGRFVATPGGTEATRGFVMTIPEPASLATLASLFAIALRRRRANSR